MPLSIVTEDIDTFKRAIAILKLLALIVKIWCYTMAE
jgi:hypothetical protein